MLKAPFQLAARFSLILLSLLFFHTSGLAQGQGTAPSKEEVFMFIRSKMLKHGATQLSSIEFDSEQCTLTLRYTSTIFTYYLNRLDPATFKWESGHLQCGTHTESVAGFIEFTDDRKGKPEYPGKASFPLYKSYHIDPKQDEPEPNYFQRMEKAFRTLILACGGKETKELF